MIRTLIGMTVGGVAGGFGGFVVMLFTADMEPSNITAILWPFGGAFTGVIAGALIASV